MNAFFKTIIAVAIPAALLILASGNSVAQDGDAAKNVEKNSPVGTWTWERKAGGKKVKTKLVVKEKEGKFSGKLKDDEHDLEIKNCSLKDGTFAFQVSPHPESPEMVIKFSGKVGADKIKGNMSFTMGGEDKSTSWEAKRFAATDVVVGKWLLTFETPDGNEVAFKLRVKKNGEGIALEFVDDDTASIDDVEFKDGTLSFVSEQVYQDQPITVEWELKIEGNQATGSLFYKFDQAAEEGELEVSGERIK